MPDDATLTATSVPPVTPTAAPADAPAPSATQPTTQAPDPGRINPDTDFAHPEYGLKLKNAHEGMTKAQAEANELRQARKALESNLAGVRSMIEKDPAVAAAMVRHLESQGQTVPARLKELAAKAAAKQVDDDDDDTRPVTKAELKAWEQKINAEFGSRDTTTDFQRAVGEGDVAKGSVIWHKDGQAILAKMDEYGLPPTTKSMLLAHKLVEQERAATRPSTTTTTQPSAASDMGRSNGAVVAAPADTVNGPPSMDEWLRAAGFSSQAEFERSLRGG